MNISKKEIIELALKYITRNEIILFPDQGDFFALCYKSLSELNKGYNLLFYGLCLNYSVDEMEKPYGKWITMEFLNFGSFPPHREILKLQPPHIATGKFQNPERTMELYIIKIPIRGQLNNIEEKIEPKVNKIEKKSQKKSKKLDNIVEFRAKK